MMEESSNTVNYHLDKSLLLFFVFTILITASIFAFKFISYIPCEIEAFNYDKGNLRVGEIIRFKDNTKSVVKRAWDFGDDSRVGITANPSHAYEKPGEYIVKLKVNGSCTWEEKLVVKQKVIPLDSSRIARFTVPEKIEIGQAIKIIDETKDATSWEWRFGESGRVDSSEKNPEYMYESSGEKTILLVVNGDPRYGIRKRITVFDKPIEEITPPKDNVIYQGRDRDQVIPDKPVGEGVTVIEKDPLEEKREDAPSFSDERFKELLSLVAKERATADNFKQYLCDNIHLPIIVNNMPTNFAELCSKIKGKRFKIESLEIGKGDYNCITSIKLKYK